MRKEFQDLSDQLVGLTPDLNRSELLPFNFVSGLERRVEAIAGARHYAGQNRGSWPWDGLEFNSPPSLDRQSHGFERYIDSPRTGILLPAFAGVARVLDGLLIIAKVRAMAAEPETPRADEDALELACQVERENPWLTPLFGEVDPGGQPPLSGDGAASLTRIATKCGDQFERVRKNGNRYTALRRLDNLLNDATRLFPRQRPGRAPDSWTRR